MINIKENTKRFKDILEKDVLPEMSKIQKFLDWVDTTDFYSAPASTKYHLCEEGGLVQHSLNCYEELMNLVKQRNVTFEDLGTTKSEATFGILFHDICKAQMYKKTCMNVKDYCMDGKCTDQIGKFNWQQKEGWKVEEELIMGHGVKSLFLIMTFVPDLSLDICQAIRYHMFGFEDLQNMTNVESSAIKAISQCKLIMYFHLSDMMATYLDE